MLALITLRAASARCLAPFASQRGWSPSWLALKVSVTLSERFNASINHDPRGAREVSVTRFCREGFMPLLASAPSLPKVSVTLVRHRCARVLLALTTSQRGIAEAYSNEIDSGFFNACIRCRPVTLARAGFAGKTQYLWRPRTMRPGRWWR